MVLLVTSALCFLQLQPIGARINGDGFLRHIEQHIIDGAETQDASLSHLHTLANQLDSVLRPFQKTYRDERGETVSKVERPSAEKVWEAFQKTMTKALDDPSLSLDKKLGPVKDDGSIFVSISSYRDPSCSATVKSAFANADNKEKVNVGIVQQNCLKNCHTGTGWGATRRWVTAQPDPDCIEDFCASAEGKPHCDAGQVPYCAWKRQNRSAHSSHDF